MRTNRLHKPKTQQLFYLLVALLLTFGVVGCASKQLASQEADLLAKQFTPPADRSYIYVIRHSTIVGSAVDITINLDGTRAGAIQNKTYTAFNVSPGQHVLKMGILRPKPKSGEEFFVPAQFELDTQPGRVYFVSGRLRNEGPEIRLLSDSEGRRLLLEENYKLVTSFIAPLTQDSQ